MATSDTEVQNLVVNKLTYDQWKTAKDGGTLSNTESYEITNLDDTVVRRKSSSAATGGSRQGVYVDANGQVQTCTAVTDTYSGTSSAPMSGKAVKSAIDAAISSAYKASGSITFANLPNPTSSLEGNVYDVSDDFTTDSKFIVSGKSYPAGTNVVVINTSGTTYKYDVLTGMVDLSGYQTLIDSSHKLSSDLVDDTNKTHKFVTSSEKTTWSGKQDALVSGTNIKTINNESLLGSGDITVSAPTYTAGTGIDITSGTIGVTSPTITNQSTNRNQAIGIGGGAGDYGVVLGTNAYSGSESISIGQASASSNGASVSIGTSAGSTGTSSVAIGYKAKANSNYAIQLGQGTNSEASSMYVATSSSNNYKMLDSNGKIPADRLTTMTGADGTNAGTLGAVPAPAATDNDKFLRGDGTWATAGGGGGGSSYTAGTGIDITNDTISVTSPTLINTATGTNSLTILGTATTSPFAVNIGYDSADEGSWNTVVGFNAKAKKSSSWGTAIGFSAYIGEDTGSAEAPIAIGKSAAVTKGSSVAIGQSATVVGEYSTAIGYNARSWTHDAIQIGQGINSEASSLYIGTSSSNNWKLLGSDGKIPAARLTAFTGSDGTTAGSIGAVPAPAIADNTKFLKGDGTWAVPSGASYTAGTGIDITNNVISVTSPTLTNTATGSNSITILGTATSSSDAIGLGKNSNMAPYHSVSIGNNHTYTSIGNGGYVALGYGITINCTTGGGRGVIIGEGTSIGEVSSYNTIIGHLASGKGNYSIALGTASSATADYAIQLGSHHTNSEANSFYVSTSTSNNWKMLGNDGLIPDARLSSNIAKLDSSNSFTGTNTFVTPAVSDNSTKAATTAYVNTKFQVVSALPANPDADTFYFIPEA